MLALNNRRKRKRQNKRRKCKHRNASVIGCKQYFVSERKSLHAHKYKFKPLSSHASILNMESVKMRTSVDTQESKMTRLSDNINKRSSFHTTVC
jgi:hypothetical protein